MKGFVWFATSGGEFDLLRPALLDRTRRQTNLSQNFLVFSSVITRPPSLPSQAGTMGEH